MASRLAAGAWSGMMIVHGTPSRRAFHATPCAMLPALAVTTPRSTVAGDAAAIALLAPRILNDPIGWRHSSFRWISLPDSTSKRTSGDRIDAPRIRDWAASISANVGASTEG